MFEHICMLWLGLPENIQHPQYLRSSLLCSSILIYSKEKLVAPSFKLASKLEIVHSKLLMLLLPYNRCWLCPSCGSLKNHFCNHYLQQQLQCLLARQPVVGKSERQTRQCQVCTKINLISSMQLFFIKFLPPDSYSKQVQKYVHNKNI